MASQDKKLRHDTIIKAAFEEFYENGCERARMEQIAKRAGIGKSTIYEYFPSKQELLLEVVQAGHSQMKKEIEDIFLTEDSLRQKLKRLLRQEYVQRIHDMAKMNRIWESIFHIPEIKEAIVNSMNDVSASFRLALKQAGDRGEIRSNVDPDVLLLWIKTLGLTLLIHQKSFTEEEAEDIINLLFLGMGVK